jgi:G2/mitotic-specific cyclin-B, other
MNNMNNINSMNHLSNINFSNSQLNQLNDAKQNILFPKKTLLSSNSLLKDESILKYTNSSGALNSNNVARAPQLPREFGRDLTNLIQIPPKKFGGVPNKYMNLIKPSRKEKEELKKQLTKNDVSLYNLRPRNSVVNSKSKNNSKNNSFSYNNENENSQNLQNLQNQNSKLITNPTLTSNFISLKNSAQVLNKPKINNFTNLNNKSFGNGAKTNFNTITFTNTNLNNNNTNINIKSNHHEDMEIDSIITSTTTTNDQEINFKSNFFNFKKDEKLDKFLNLTKPTLNSINPLPQNVSEYLLDIYQHLKSTELHFYPKYGYMKNQPDINEKMRAILIDWLVDVHLKFKLLPETLFLTTQIIDRFLEKIEINRNKLQLVGVTSLFIACKYEEIYPPELKDFVYITDKAYTKSDILLMEKEILNVLNFDITHPSTLRFLDVYIQLLDVKFEENLNFYLKYLLELFLIEYKMIKYSPSLIAAASIYTMMKVKKLYMNIDIPLVSGYSEEKLKECARDILVILDGVEKSALQAVRNKYMTSKFLEVAKGKNEKGK